ncbi:hypothetical protein AJ80_09656 [Polytolypa hystricis UAMH7299]|uniref:Altered inheritance of mitochondria protein 9, mitochondrial n=1 Tax=Polytolypa hystricis (strain UAMH7299) TaxID=1447883 RepID=A0A2B7WE04_POLH7|nr:hypothetical protein AJ80_09656 [Polytolypa hystricis UAMH7299]
MKGATIFQHFSATRLSSRRFYRDVHLSRFSSSHHCVSKHYSRDTFLTAHYPQSQSLRLMSVDSKVDDRPHADLFQYTSGCWLWDEEQQLRDRFTPFNVSELQRIAASSIGANKCVTMTKLAEGSFNKTFRLIMDNGSAAIARIPHPIAGPKYYTTASEVATMDFARTVLRIPIPQVHAWNARVDNPVGAEYIIMEEAPGTKLEDVWDELSLEDRVAIMEDLVSIENKLLSISFNSYGNLYYSNEAISGAVVAEVVNDNTTPEVKTEQYVVALAHHELEWIKQYAVPKSADDLLVTSADQNTRDTHISLLHKYLQVAPYLLPTEPDIITSTIWHTDLHSGNLFVDKGCITNIIDWQGIWAGPLVLQARYPRLIDHHGDIILKPPSEFQGP